MLYRGLGFVFRLQYDPVFRRLLADAGSEIYERQACELYSKGQALILEFGELQNRSGKIQKCYNSENRWK